MLEARAVLMESLQKRYVARFSAQIVSGLILLLSQSLMLRGLGPKEYGDYTFTTQFFTQLTAFLDFGVSVAFFTKLSQRPNDLGLIRFYYSYWVVLGLLQLLFLLVAFGWPLSSVLWPGQSFASVLFGLFWALSNHLWQGTSRIADAYALTTRSEKVKVVMRVGALLVLLPFFFTKSLTLTVVFGSQILSYAILTFVLYRIARPDGGVSWNFQLKTFLTYGREVFEFCIPLFWYGLVSLIASIFDNWMLQRFGGSMQQGYFGLSTQLNFICLLFGTAMMPLIHRELAVASARGSGMRELYLKCVFPVVTGAAFFAVFIAVNAREIILFFSGSAYLPAVTAVTLGVLYTVPQSFSQLYLSLRCQKWIEKLRLARHFEWTGVKNLTLGAGLRIAEDCHLLASGGKIVLGNRVGLNSGTILDATPSGEIKLADNVIVGPRCIFRACNHDFKDPHTPVMYQGHLSGKISVGEGTWIGAHCVLLPGVTIGKHVIIGAGAVVTGNIPDYAIAAGVPARVLKFREQNSKLLTNEKASKKGFSETVAQASPAPSNYEAAPKFHSPEAPSLK